MEEKELLEQEIRNLISRLTAPTSEVGDYKIIKCYEANLMEQEMPYDYESLIVQRKRIRNRINEIEELLKEYDE